MAPIVVTGDDVVIKRPPCNYQQRWDYEFFITLKNDYPAELYAKEAATLQDDMRLQLDHLCMEKNSMALLELIGNMQRLGLGYSFKRDIHKVMNFLAENNVQREASLYATSLYFMVFRQHGFNASQDVFKAFKDPDCCFKENLRQDIKGILSLFEASHLASEGEDTLDEGKAFARSVLSDVKEDIDANLGDQVTHALRLPLHYNMQRLEARWYIDSYSKRNDANANLLRYAKLDYNMRQGVFREELAVLSRWWNRLGLANKLPFARDCLFQSFASAIGFIDEPQHGYCRQGLTKMLTLLSVLDDVYDAYATLDEGKLLSDAFDRWDIKEMDGLPDYMKLLFLALYNIINEFAYDAMKEKGLNLLPYIRKLLKVFIKACMTELKWVKTGYVPTLQEYLMVTCPSLIVTIFYSWSYVFMSPEVSTETLDYMASYPDIIHSSCLIIRLINDISTGKYESERGEDVNAIHCYMNDEGVNKEAARIYINNLIENMWHKLNAELLSSPLPRDTAMLILDTTRVAEVFYRSTDGFGHPDSEMQEHFSALVFTSIPFERFTETC